MKYFWLVMSSFLATGYAFAGDAQWTESQATTIKAACYFLAVAIAAFGGTRSQSAAATAAFNGMARNPAAADKLFVPMILSFALMESLVIFTLISVYLI